MEDLLAEKPAAQLEKFLSRCAEVSSVNTDTIRKIATETTTYLKGNQEKRQSMECGQALQKQWYDSLAAGQPDFSVYATDYYLAELWACWTVYSRQALRGILSEKSLPDFGGIAKNLGAPKRIVDLGCGCGYTTAALKQMFPASEVVGTNIGDTVQSRIAVLMGKEFGFTVVDDLAKIGGADTVFASEYFEHIEEPIGHLREVLSLRPSAMLVANAFGTKAIGHFTTYKLDDVRVSGEDASKFFHNAMRGGGYTKIKTKLWNNRPSYWVRTGKRFQ